jgi:hypothetical protein
LALHVKGKFMAKKTKETKTKRRTKVTDMPKGEVTLTLTPAQAKRVKGGQGYRGGKGFQIISAGRDGDPKK